MNIDQIKTPCFMFCFQTQAVLINANGTTYQIVTPVNLVGGNISVANVVSSPAANTVQYSSGTVIFVI